MRRVRPGHEVRSGFAPPHEGCNQAGMIWTWTFEFGLYPLARWEGLGPAGCIPDGVTQTQQEGIGSSPFELRTVGEKDAPLAGAANDSRLPVMAGQRGRVAYGAFLLRRISHVATSPLRKDRKLCLAPSSKKEIFEMSFTCDDCRRRLLRVEDIRNCARCRTHGRALNIPEEHANDDLLTPTMIGYALGAGFTSSEPAPVPDVSGGGGEFSGAGASGSWTPDPPAPSSDTGSSSSSTDSGGGGSGSSE